MSKHIVRLLSNMPEGQADGREPGGAELVEQFIAVVQAIKKRANARMSAAGLSLSRFRVLRALGAGPMRMNELSSVLGVVPRTTTTLADALEQEGLVRRLPDPADRRATLIEATGEGMRQLRVFKEAHDASAARLFDRLSPAERRQLAALLDRLRDPAPDAPGNSTPGHGARAR
jgi:DNA-binding MarR family transcriptional regulator